MKKFLTVLLASVLVFPSVSTALELPNKISEWRLTGEHVVPLITQPDNINLGRCVYKNYESNSPLGELQIILTEGKGAGTLYVPDEDNAKSSEGLLPSSSGYEVVNISGKRAVLETNENLPVSLAIRYDENITLTIETNSLNEHEIKMFAESLLAAL